MYNIKSLYCLIEISTLDFLTDKDLEEVTKIIMGTLNRDWTILLAYLGIPEHLKPVIDDQRLTLRQQIMKLLTKWRNLQEDRSTLRSVLADKLLEADPSLHEAASFLRNTYRPPQ